jgi:hypothetical protein
MMNEMRRPVMLALAATLILAACGGGGSKTTTDATTASSTPAVSTNALTAPGRENIAFDYMRIRANENLTKFGAVSLIVAGKTAGRHSAQAIKATGAQAYRGVQAYWFTTGSSYDGMEVERRADWAFCLDGAQPLVARTVAGDPWFFLDANEKAVRTAFAQRLQILKREGWDGVFFDRGFAALTGEDVTTSPAWNKTSTCTQDPVDPKATLADAYVGMASEVKHAGLKLIMNYGVSPFDARTPMRPDPRDPGCDDPSGKQCATLHDVWPSVDGMLDEAVAHPRDIDWANDYRSNRLNEQNATQGKVVVGLLTQGTMGGTHSREAAYFEWARVKLFVVPLAVNTGDDNCGNPPPGTLCNRQALYPELANIQFGAPLEPEPQASQCRADSKIDCIWTRRYANGMSLANVTDAKTNAGPIKLGVDGCRYVKDVETQQPLAVNQCVTTASLDVDAWSGHPLVYSKSPW